MNLIKQIAKNIRDLYFGENWTTVNFKDTLSDITWDQATVKFNSMNTIASLLYHTNYYNKAVINVLQGNMLTAHDNDSFDHPRIESPGDWESLLNETWSDVETLTTIVELLPESKLLDTFSEEKYGNYYVNIHGLIEHGYYHLGQIVWIKKYLLQTML